MELNIKHNFFIFIFTIIMFISCQDSKESKEYDETMIGKYYTEYTVYYSTYAHDLNTIYTDDSVYTCSFQGTNFLLEQNNTEELLSTTAPIRIIKCFKIR